MRKLRKSSEKSLKSDQVSQTKRPSRSSNRRIPRPSTGAKKDKTPQQVTSTQGMTLKNKNSRPRRKISLQNSKPKNSKLGKNNTRKRNKTPSQRSLRSSRASTGRSQRSLMSRSSNASKRTLPKIHTEKLEFKKKDDCNIEDFTNSNKKHKKSTSQLRQVKGSLKKIRRVESSPLKNKNNLVSKSATKRPIYKPLVIKETTEEAENSPIMSQNLEFKKAKIGENTDSKESLQFKAVEQAPIYLESPSFRAPLDVNSSQNGQKNYPQNGLRIEDADGNLPDVTQNILMQDKELKKEILAARGNDIGLVGDNTETQNKFHNGQNQHKNVHLLQPNPVQNNVPIIGNLSEKDHSNVISLDNSKDITLNSLKKEFVNITANSSIPNIEEDVDIEMIEEVSRTIRKFLAIFEYFLIVSSIFA